MKKSSLLAIVALISLLLLPIDALAQRKTLGVSKVKLNPSVASVANRDNTKLELERVAEAIDGQLISAFNGTRKFDIIARSDIDSLLEEAALTGRPIEVAEVEFAVVPTIDDFQDIVETANFSGIGMIAERRRVRLGMVARIYESQTGLLLEAPSFQIDNFDTEQLSRDRTRTGAFSDELLRKISTEISEKIVHRVVDVVFPARIVAKTGKTVTINRGDGTGIATGQLWEVFALGEDLIDPDTGISLGREEVMVGAVRVTRITPMTAQAEVVGDDMGIDRGAVLRKVE